MTMEQGENQSDGKGETQSDGTPSSTAQPQSVASLLAAVEPQNLHYSLLFEEDTCATYVCHLCKKTFYNETALQNHRNMQHDVEDSSSDGAGHMHLTESLDLEMLMHGLCEFKFIAHPNGNTGVQTIEDGLTKRTFLEDTSYLIVKVECEEDESSKRNDGILKKNQIKTRKQSVDLRGPFKCTFRLAMRPELQCHQVFFSCCEYSLHYREAHTRRRKAAALRCQVCERRLDQDVFVKNVPSPLVFYCRLCGQTFLNKANFDEHNNVAHAKTKPHQCSICSKRFTQQGGLQQHMRMHTGIRPFACTFCPKAFTQKAGLDQHLRTHTKVKPYRCVICSKSFSQSVHLRQHMRTHTNIQPFACSVCERRFKQSSHLNFHMRSHITENGGTLMLERYAQAMRQRETMDFLNLSNLQPVRDGETVYYAAELTGPATFQSQNIN